mgnify:FL=1
MKNNNVAKKMVSAVIFDMGGVLLRTLDYKPRDSIAQKFKVTRQELETIVFSSPSSILTEEGKLSIEQHSERISEELKIDRRRGVELLEKFFEGDEINIELIEYINKLRAAGMFTGLLSNAWSGTRARIEDSYPDFLGNFDDVIFSAEVGLRKPTPQIFTYALQRLQVTAEEAIFVDEIGRAHV